MGRPQLRLAFGFKQIPHPSKAHYGGEDAFFVSEVGHGAMGISDGVGGWAEVRAVRDCPWTGLHQGILQHCLTSPPLLPLQSGVNPADYSKTFMVGAIWWRWCVGGWRVGLVCTSLSPSH